MGTGYPGLVLKIYDFFRANLACKFSHAGNISGLKSKVQANKGNVFVYFGPKG